nr:PREDICTED: NAD kinase-like [Latimeria chalumnae]|eukprot:XP_014342008.1 PREDICTED: NAD kinase-like [Latimeria chalumnae]
MSSGRQSPKGQEEDAPFNCDWSGREVHESSRPQQDSEQSLGKYEVDVQPCRQNVSGGKSHAKQEDREQSPGKQRRKRFLHGPNPSTYFGPKACISSNPSSVIHMQDPATQMLTWNKPPVSVLVLKKISGQSVLEPFKQLCRFLIEEKRLTVYVEKKVAEDTALAKDESFDTIRSKIFTFREGQDDISNCIDLIICLGGDGTLLYASSLFQRSVPPVMAFHLGTLGFLTPFRFEFYKTEVTKAMEGNAAIMLRSRLKVKVVKEREDSQRPENRYKVEDNGLVPQSFTDSETGRVTFQVQVLNEVVIDRGPSSYLSNIDLYLDGRRITSVQGDGVIVSTPTGSTAYAAAAGASMIHPNVPAIMVTPICPHSLSFRPIVVPAGVELMIMLSPNARNTVWISFDGRKRQEIKHGDSSRTDIVLNMD